MHEHYRHKFLGWWSDVVSRRPGAVLAVAALLAMAAVGLTASQLTFQSNRNDLISPDLDWNQRFIAWRETFGGGDDFVIAVDTHRPDGAADEQARARARAVVDELGPKLAAHEQVLDVLWGFDAAAFHPRAIRLQPMPDFERDLARLAQAGPLLASPTPQALLGAAASQMQQGSATPSATDPEAMGAAVGAFARLIEAFDQRLQTPADQPMDFEAAVMDPAAESTWQYLHTDNERFLLLLVTPRAQPDAINAHAEAIVAVRQVLADTAAAHPQVEMGMTGITVIEADETSVAMLDSTRASVLAVVLITALLVLAFQSFRVPLLMMIALGVGIAWSFGFLTLVIGHLQVISVVFVVMLLGLGVAFGIHLASRFEMVRHGHADTLRGFRLALRDTLETMGPGLLTGALTTAAAFAMTLLTDFRGVAEMGAIAAAGILLCLIAMCSVFPALLRRYKTHHKQTIRMEDRFVHLFDERWIGPFSRHPVSTLIVAAIAGLLSLGAMTQLRFDYNLLALMPRNVDSMKWQERIIDEGEQSVWTLTSITDSLADARARTEAFRELGTVDAVGGVGLLFPADERAKLARIEQVRDTLAAAAQTNSTIASQQLDLVQQIGAMRLMLGLMQGQAPADLQPAITEARDAMDSFLRTAGALEPAVRAERLAALQRDYAQWRQSVAERVAGALDTGPMQLSDLPPRLLRPYVAQTEQGTKLAIEVQPRVPADIADPLDPQFLGRFVEDARQVDPNITGVMVQFYRSGALIWNAYLTAGLYALLAVFALVWIDFRSLADAVLCLVPVAAGFAVTFAIMVLAGMPLNPANIMVLPLMFGIGVDAGVHVIHRYRQSPHARPLGLTAGTGKGITLTSFTTMIGFGSLLIAEHRGIAGLGFVLSVGISMTLLACWTIMPAWLELRTRKLERVREPVAVGAT